jgi:hypothetical protein
MLMVVVVLVTAEVAISVEQEVRMMEKRTRNKVSYHFVKG